MHTRVFFLSLPLVLLLIISATYEVTMIVNSPVRKQNNFVKRDSRLFPFRWNIPNVFNNNKKPAPVYLLSGTVCRYINLVPICTYMSTSGVAMTSAAMTAGQLVTRPTGGTSSTSGSQANVQRPGQSGGSSVTMSGQRPTQSGGSGTATQRPAQSGGSSGGSSGQRPQSGSQQGSSQSGMSSGGQRGSTQSNGGFNLGAPLSLGSPLSLGAIYDDNEAVRNIANVQLNLNPSESSTPSDESEETSHHQQDDLGTLTSVPAFERKQQPENISTRQDSVQPIGYLVVKKKSPLKLGNVLRLKK